MGKKIILLYVPLINMLLMNMANADIPRLIDYWNFDESFGRIAADSSGNKNNGELVGDVEWQPTSGKVRGALSFNGTGSSYVKIPTAGMLAKTGTIAFWICLAEPKDGENQYRYLFECLEGADINRIQLYMDMYDTKLDLGLGDRHRRHNSIVNLAVGTWYQIVLTWDGSNYAVYVNGENKAEGTYTGLTNVGAEAYIGCSGRRPQVLNGLMDEVAIFDQPLSESEVTNLYKFGVTLFFTVPSLQTFIDAAQKSGSVLKEQGPQKAAAFLEEKIAELEQRKKEDPNNAAFFYQQMIPQLYFQLAKAKEASGLPKENIAAAYKLAIQSEMPKQQGSALLWLYENLSAEEYQTIIQSLVKNNNDYLKEVAATATTMIDEQKLMAAIKFIESNLAAYENWRRKYPFDNPVVTEDRLPKTYFQLAKAKETAGDSKKDIAEAYTKTFYPSHSTYISERTEALIWLLDNDCNDKYKEVIRSFTQNQDTKNCFNNVVSNLSKHLESKKDWTKFERFLDVLFVQAKYPSYWAVFVESCLSNKTNPWAKEYFNYIDRNPRLKFIRDCAVAEKSVTEGQFKKAAELYRDIVTRCKPEDDKTSFEFKLCECLYKAEEYRQVIPLFENFIANNKVTHRNLVKEAMLMKSCTYIELNEIDKAVDDLLTLMTEYPDTKEATEANYFLGYCYMLQGKFGDAEEAFNSLLKSYPESAYTEKARRHLTRMKDMTEK